MSGQDQNDAPAVAATADALNRDYLTEERFGYAADRLAARGLWVLVIGAILGTVGASGRYASTADSRIRCQPRPRA